MLENEKTSRHTALMEVARAMMVAARTAPKAKGVDNLEIAVSTGETIILLADKLRELAPVLNRMFFIRDAQNIEQAEAVVLIGTRLANQGLDCGYCGSSTCNSKPEAVPCVFNTHDLGIAVGSAAAVAADHRVDSRVMYSVGVAAKELELLPGCHAIFAIPISCTGKSPFFDRPTTR